MIHDKPGLSAGDGFEDGHNRGMHKLVAKTLPTRGDYDVAHKVGFGSKTFLEHGPTLNDFFSEAERKPAGFIRPEKKERTGGEWLAAFLREPLLLFALERADLGGARAEAITPDELQQHDVLRVKDYNELLSAVDLLNERFLLVLEKNGVEAKYIKGELVRIMPDEIKKITCEHGDTQTSVESFRIFLDRNLLNNMFTAMETSQQFAPEEVWEIKNRVKI